MWIVLYKEILTASIIESVVHVGVHEGRVMW